MFNYKIYLGGKAFKPNIGKTTFAAADRGDSALGAKMYGTASVVVNSSAKTVTVTFSGLNWTAEKARANGRLYCALSCKRQNNHALAVRKGIGYTKHHRWAIKLTKSLSSSLSATFTFAEIYDSFSKGTKRHAAYIKHTYSSSTPWMDAKFMLCLSYYGESAGTSYRGLHTNFNLARCYLNSSANAIDRIEMSYTKPK